MLEGSTIILGVSNHHHAQARENKELMREKGDCITEIGRLKEHIHSLQKELGDTKQSKNQLCNENKRLEEIMEENRHIAAVWVKERDEEINRVQKENGNLKAELEKERENLNKAKQELDKVNQKIKELEQVNTGLKQSFDGWIKIEQTKSRGNSEDCSTAIPISPAPVEAVSANKAPIKEEHAENTAKISRSASVPYVHSPNTAKLRKMYLDNIIGI